MRGNNSVSSRILDRGREGLLWCSGSLVTWLLLLSVIIGFFSHDFTHRNFLEESRTQIDYNHSVDLFFPLLISDICNYHSVCEFSDQNIFFSRYDLSFSLSFSLLHCLGNETYVERQ